jgi:copper transport protein
MVMRWLILTSAAVAIWLVAAPSAFAHARLIRTDPADGAVLATAPDRVVLAFDDSVRPVGGTTVIRNGGGSVLAGKPSLLSGDHILVLPLRRLKPGDYTARWRIVSDDGHLISGVLAFAVGQGSGTPTPALSAGGGSRAPFGIARWIFLVGLLLAAGTVGWVLVVRRPATRDGAGWAGSLDRLERIVLCAALSVAACGLVAALLIEPDAVSTRFGRASQAGIALAVVGGFAAGFSLGLRRLVDLAGLCALGLVVTEALSGHALDPGQPRALAAVANVLHLAAVSFWAGGLAWLAVLVPLALRSLEGGERSRALARLAGRFSFPALVAVLVLAASGVTRAWTELSGFDQLWTTRYGAVLLAKTVIFAGLVALGWRNRVRLLPALSSAVRRNPAGPRAFARLRRNVSAELVLIGLALVAVAMLIDLQPGTVVQAEARAAASPRSAGVVVLPPRGAFVGAAEDDDVAVALAAQPAGAGLRLQASVIGPDGQGLSGLHLTYRVRTPAGVVPAPAADCGAGCYSATARARRPRSVTVAIDAGPEGKSTAVIPMPSSWPAPSGAALVGRAARAFRALRSVVIAERLASSASDVLVTTWTLAAPDRLAYRTVQGPQAVVIGKRRWDRDIPRGPWQASTTEVIRQPSPFWGDGLVTNAHVLGTARIGARPVTVVSFLARSIPAWFTIWVEPASGRLLRLRMTAASHFMLHRYRDFDAAPPIRPPTGRRG